nr:hypothetical protein [Streptococcus anginosus]
SSFLLLSFSIILPYLIVDLKLCNRTETGVSYYFVWQPHTNLLWLNGASPQEFIRDGTKDYIKSLANK